MERAVTTFSHPARTALTARRSWPSAAVFDCDGLLVDSERCWHEAYRAVAAAAGRSLGDVDLAVLNGASVGLAAERLSAALAAPISHELLRDELERAVAELPVEAMPGAHELLGTLACELPLAVASNAPVAIVDAVLRRTGLRHHFATIVSAEQVAAPKPWPHVYLEACRQLAVDPSDAIAFEDSLTGAAAARAGGLLLIAVPSQRTARIEADLTVPRLDDVRVLSLFGL
jgi:HAD superfamily hydrolase (TIGR01509 family)